MNHRRAPLKTHTGDDRVLETYYSNWMYHVRIHLELLERFAAIRPPALHISIGRRHVPKCTQILRLHIFRLEYLRTAHSAGFWHTAIPGTGMRYPVTNSPHNPYIHTWSIC